jgi:hypothetical protein
MSIEVALEHGDLVDEELFNTVVYRGTTWDLEHLKPYSFVVTVDGISRPLRVVVIFACHCFTREATLEERTLNLVPDEDWYSDDRETRVLDEERYLLSKKYLPTMVKDLVQRKIYVADENRKSGNFVTREIETGSGTSGLYSLFFEVENERKHKLKLRVQSAYVRGKLTRRESEAKSVRLHTIFKAAFHGKKIKA